VLKDAELSNFLPAPPLQGLPAQRRSATGQPTTAGSPLPKRALEMAGQHLTILATTLTPLRSETQEPPKSSSQTNPAASPASHHHPWWWRGLHPQGQTLESHTHTSSVRAKGRTQSLRLNPSFLSPSTKTKFLCYITGS